MGLLDTILGRTKPVKPDLDALFALPSAAVTLDASLGLKPTGVGSVCVKPAEGGGFAGLREQIDQLLAADNDKYDETKDSFGFSWITRTGSADDLSDLVTDLHCSAPWSCSATRPGRRSAWSTSTSAARGIRLHPPAPSNATTRGSSPYALLWVTTSRSSLTCPGGSRSGARRGYDT
jgi:hypothetical protein